MTAMISNVSNSATSSSRRYVPESLREMKRQAVGRKFNIGSLAANCPTSSSLNLLEGVATASDSSGHIRAVAGSENQQLDFDSVHDHPHEDKDGQEPASVAASGGGADPTATTGFGGGGGIMSYLPKKVTEAVEEAVGQLGSGVSTGWATATATASTTTAAVGRGMRLARQTSYLDVQAKVPRRHRSSSPTLRTRSTSVGDEKGQQQQQQQQQPRAGSSSQTAAATAPTTTNLRQSSSMVDLRSRRSVAPSANGTASTGQHYRGNKLNSDQRSSEAMGAAMIGMAMSLSMAGSSRQGNQQRRRGSIGNKPSVSSPRRHSSSLDTTKHGQAASSLKKLDRRMSMRDFCNSSTPQAQAPATPTRGAAAPPSEMAQRRSVMMKRQNSTIDLLSGASGGTRTRGGTKKNPPRKSSSLDSAGMDGAMGMGMSFANITMPQQELPAASASTTTTTRMAASCSNFGVNTNSSNNCTGIAISERQNASNGSLDRASNHSATTKTTPPRRVSRRTSLRGSALVAANDMIMASPGRRSALTPGGRQRKPRRPSSSCLSGSSLHSQNSASGKSPKGGRQTPNKEHRGRHSLLQKSATRPSLGNVDFSDDDDDDDDVSIDLMVACEQPNRNESSRQLSSVSQTNNNSSTSNSKKHRRSMSSSISMPQQRRFRPVPSTPNAAVPKLKRPSSRLMQRSRSDECSAYCTPRRSVPASSIRSVMKDLQSSGPDLSVDDISIDDRVAYHRSSSGAGSGRSTPRRSSRRSNTFRPNHLKTHLLSNNDVIKKKKKKSSMMINDDISIDDTITYQLDKEKTSSIKKKKPPSDDAIARSPRRTMQRSTSCLDQRTTTTTLKESSLERSFCKRESAAIIMKTPNNKKKLPLTRSKTFDSSVLGALKTLAAKPIKSFSKNSTATSKKIEEKKPTSPEKVKPESDPQENKESAKGTMEVSSEPKSKKDDPDVSTKICSSADEEVAGNAKTKNTTSSSLPTRTTSKSKSKSKSTACGTSDDVVNGLHGSAQRVVSTETTNPQRNQKKRSQSVSRESNEELVPSPPARADMQRSPKKSSSNRTRRSSSRQQESSPTTKTESNSRKSRSRGRSKEYLSAPTSSSTTPHPPKTSSTKESSRSRSTSKARSSSKARKREKSSRHDHHKDSKQRSCREEKTAMASSSSSKPTSAPEEKERASIKSRSKSRSRSPNRYSRRSSSRDPAHPKKDKKSDIQRQAPEASPREQPSRRNRRSASPSTARGSNKVGRDKKQVVEDASHGSSGNISYMREPSGTWPCTCGATVSKEFNFCGVCGTRKHWTCSGCQYDQNLRIFAFCTMCGAKPVV